MYGKKNGAVGELVLEDAHWRPHVTGSKTPPSYRQAVTQYKKYCTQSNNAANFLGLTR